MVERILSMGDYLSINDVRKVVTAAKDMKENEELMIAMNSQESDKVENIFSVLKKHDFECTTKGGHDGKNYYIIVRKKYL
ncbi:MAG: hypothetical protein WBL93_12555 [Lutisporaceae bacterium]